MKILVPVKRVVDYNVRIRVKPDESCVELDGVKMSMNPFDEIAVEEAVRLKESGVASEIIAVSIGGDGVVETLRTALAMGADKAIHLKTNDIIQPLAAAKLLKQIVTSVQAELVIAGKQAIDDDANQTGQMLAALLGCGVATFASSLKIIEGFAHVVREVDGGLMSVSLPLPCVVTTDLRLNQPRYASLPNIMKARVKPIETIDVATIAVDLTPRFTVQKVTAPHSRKSGIKVADVDTLLDKLSNEAKVI
jgi:electron transfer flavoprotein beta subunit